MLQNVQHITNNHRNLSLIQYSYQFISMDIALLLVVNCKSNIIINITQCNYLT